AAGSAAAVVVQLDLVAHLLVAVEGQHVGDAVGQHVEVDVGLGIRLALGDDVLQGEVIVDAPVDGGRGALHLGVVDVGHAAADVVAVVERLLAEAQPRVDDVVQQVGRQHLAAADAGLVVQPVHADIDVEVLGDEGAQLQAGDVDFLVADVLAGVEVAAEAVVVEAGDGEAGAQAAVLAADRAADGGLGVQAAVVAGSQLDGATELGRQAAGDVLDGAADGVLAVQGALRATQHLDALDVEHVQQRALRPGDVDVVEVDAHARIHAPERVGLADAADIGGDRAGGAAGGVDGQVGHLRVEVAQVLDVELF